MRIGHYTLEMWKPGGISTYIRRIGAAQRQAGHEVILLDRGATVPPWAAAFAFQGIDDDAALYRAAERLKLDVLHVHTMIQSPQQASTPILRTLHGHEPYCPSGGRFLARTSTPCSRNYSWLGCAWGHFIDRCGSIRPAAMSAEFARTRAEMSHTRQITVLTVSDYLRRQMLRAGYDAARVHALALPAPEARDVVEMPGDGEPRFVFLGRLTPHKGVDWLLEAAAKVKSPIHLDIAGDGNSRAALEALTSKLALEKRVHFHGWIDETRVGQLLDRCRALVFPSLWQEPAGLVAFEAAVHGRPAIASRVGGIPEMVFDSLTGLLVEPGDVAGLAAAMGRLADDAVLARRLGQQGRSIVPAQFSLADHMQALQQFYEQCISQRA